MTATELSRSQYLNLDYWIVEILAKKMSDHRKVTVAVRSADIINYAWTAITLRTRESRLLRSQTRMTHVHVHKHKHARIKRIQTRQPKTLKLES